MAPGLARACPLLSATVSRRRGAYFKPATRDCKSPAEDFSNLFPPARVFHTEGGRSTEGAGGGGGAPPVSANPLNPVGPGFLDPPKNNPGMGHAGMAHALRGLRAPGLPGVSVPSVF